MRQIVRYKDEGIVANLVKTSNQKHEILMKPVVQNALTDIEFKIAKDSIIGYDKDNKLIESRRPIKALSDEELMVKIQETLKYMVRDIGIKNWSGEDATYESSRFFKLLRDYYSKFTYREIQAAFDLSITGQLDEYLPKNSKGEPDKNHYQSFNAEYVGKIISAYSKYKNRLWSKINKLNPIEEKEISEDDLEKSYQFFKNKICSRFDSFKKDGIMIEFIEPYVIYAILKDKGLIKDDVEVSSDEMENVFKQYLLNSNLNDIARGRLIKDYQNQTDNSTLITLYRNEKYKKAIKQVFQKCVKEKVNISTYL